VSKISKNTLYENKRTLYEVDNKNTEYDEFDINPKTLSTYLKNKEKTEI